MKKLLLQVLLLSALLTRAQFDANPAEHIPFHLQMLQNNGGMKQTDPSNRAIVYRVIANEQDAWDNPGSAWMHVDSQLFTRNTGGVPLTTNNFRYEGGQWNNFTRETYTYDANSNLTLNLTEAYINYLSVFRNDWQTQSTFNSSNDNLLTITQRWDTTGNTWFNKTKYIRSFDGNHHVTQQIFQIWNAGTSNWDPNTRIDYIYDANGNPINVEYMNWNSGTSTWQNATRYLYTYNANSLVTENITKIWNLGTTTWDNVNRYTYTYDSNNNNIGYFKETWSVTVWVPQFRYTYYYNTANQPTGWLRENYQTGPMTYENYSQNFITYDVNGDATMYEYLDWSGHTWIGNRRYTYAYDGNHNRIYELDELYNTSNFTYENQSRYFYYYQAFNVSAVNQLKNELGACIYPNPASNIMLQFWAEENTGITINVFDVAGRLIITQTQGAVSGVNSLQLSGANMVSGNYFIQVTDNRSHQQSVLKFIKQ